MTTMTISHHDDTPTGDDSPFIACSTYAVRLHKIGTLRVDAAHEGFDETQWPTHLHVSGDCAPIELEGQDAIDFLCALHEADPSAGALKLMKAFCPDGVVGGRCDRAEDDDEAVLEAVRAHGRERGLTDEQAEKVFEVAKATAHGGLNELILRLPELAEAMQDDTEPRDDRQTEHDDVGSSSPWIDPADEWPDGDQKILIAISRVQDSGVVVRDVQEVVVNADRDIEVPGTSYIVFGHGGTTSPFGVAWHFDAWMPLPDHPDA